MLTEIIISVILLFVLWTLYVNKRPSGYPKGPMAWPILGHFHLLFKNCPKGLWHIFLAKCTKQYGKIFAFDFGAATPAVVISDAKLIREAYNNPAIQGRIDMLSSQERTGGVNRGIIFHDGPEWSEQRRFALRQLREFGFGKASMETMIMDEVQGLLERLERDSGRPISTVNYFNVAVVNALWTIISGERLNEDDPRSSGIIEALYRSSSQNLVGFLASFFPVLVKIAPKLIGWEDYKKELVYAYEYLRSVTTNKLKNYDENSHENFADVYIREIKKMTDPGSSFYGERGPLSMTAVLLDLFTGGSDTSSTTISWTCLFLAVHPEKQQKLQEELDVVLGDRNVTLDDRPKLPYLEAVIMETLRIAPVIPMTMHRATEDTHLAGYFVPKNTGVLANMYAVQHDEEIWGDPENFRPERFINDDGSCNTKHEAFLPFAVGKRVCIGETLAKNELFLFLGSIFKKFEVTWDPNEPKPSPEPVDGLVVGPKPHKLVFKIRKAA